MRSSSPGEPGDARGSAAAIRVTYREAIGLHR